MLWWFLSDFFVTQLYFWPFLFVTISQFAATPEDTSSFPEGTLPVVTSSSLKCSRIKCTSTARVLSAREVRAGVLTWALWLLVWILESGGSSQKKLHRREGALPQVQMVRGPKYRPSMKIARSSCSERCSCPRSPLGLLLSAIFRTLFILNLVN